MTDTAFASAFAKQGIHPRDAAFNIAIAKYINSGGTWAEGRRLYDAAERMSGMGQSDRASKGQSHSAQTRQPLEGGEANGPKPQGHSMIASPPSSNHDERGHSKNVQSDQINDASSRRAQNRGGEGQSESANRGHSKLALPVRETPKPSRGLAAIVSIQPVVKEAYMFTHKTSDGKPWGNVGWHELPGMKRDGAVARLILKRVAAPPNQFSRLNDILTDAQFMEMHDAAQKQIAAV